MVVFFLYIINGVLLEGRVGKNTSAHFCIHQTIGLYVKIYHILALVLMQLERFLAMRRPFFSEEINARHCALTILASFIFTLILTIIGVTIERKFLYCQTHTIQLFINPVSICLVSYPTLLAIIFTLLVSAVLRNQARRLNSIQPQVKLGLQVLPMQDLQLPQPQVKLNRHR